MESLQVIWIPLSQDEGNPLEVIVHPSMLIIAERSGNLQWKMEIGDLKWRGIPCLSANNINYVWLKTIKVVTWRSVSLLNVKNKLQVLWEISALQAVAFQPLVRLRHIITFMQGTHYTFYSSIMASHGGWFSRSWRLCNHGHHMLSCGFKIQISCLLRPVGWSNQTWLYQTWDVMLNMLL